MYRCSIGETLEGRRKDGKKTGRGRAGTWIRVMGLMTLQ